MKIGAVRPITLTEYNQEVLKGKEISIEKQRRLTNQFKLSETQVEPALESLKRIHHTQSQLLPTIPIGNIEQEDNEKFSTPIGGSGELSIPT